MIEPSRLDFVCRFQDIQWKSFNLDCDKDISCSSLSSLYIPLLTLSGFDMSQSNGVYKLNNFEHMWREEKKHMMAFAYHFINSTVHTSKVIWALKTIEKLMNAFFTDEKRHGYMKQRLPLLAESWSTPTQGLRVTLWGGGGYTSGTSLVLTDEAWHGRQGREDRLIWAILHNLAF